MPIEINNTDELKNDITQIVKDGQVTPDESDVAVKSLNTAFKIMTEHDNIMAEQKAEYEDKLKQKDALIVKISSLVAGSFFGQSALQFWLFNVPLDKLLIAGLLFLCSFLGSIGILYLQKAFPSLLPKFKSTVEVIKPLVDPNVKQGLEGLEKLVEGEPSG